MQWYENSFRRLLVDMQIPDWNEEFLSKFDPDNYAEMMSLARIDTAEIYAGSCLGLCYWPTEVGFRHRRIQDRDFLGETIKACRKHRLNVVIYLNVWSRAAYNAHPDWRMILYDNKGTVEHVPWRFGLCCPNTPFGSYFLKLLNELNSSYDCQGVWIDMIGWFNFICYCPACRERFRNETGYEELPRTIDWNDPVWLAFQRCRQNWLGEFAGQVTATIKKRTPSRSVALQMSSILCSWRGAAGTAFSGIGDYLAGDFTDGRIEQSLICKLFFSLSRNRPLEFMTPRCETLEHHTTERSFINLLMRSYAALANQAVFTLIDAVDPEGTLDRRFYEHAGAVNDSYKRYEKYLSAASMPLADVFIYYPENPEVPFPEKCTAVEETKGDGAADATKRNLITAFQEKHRLFGFVSTRNKLDPQRIPVLVLSDCAFLTDAECLAIEEYVRSGGRLYASRNSSLYDPEQGELADFKLARVFGTHYLGKRTPPVTYIAPAEEGRLGDAVPKYPVMLDGAQNLIAADSDSEIWGTLSLPCSEPDELNFFGSAISNPPWRVVGTPAVVRHRYGRGDVLYVAGTLEAVPYDFQRGIFMALLGQLHGPPIVDTNVPGTVEITVFRQPDKHRLVISILNLPPDLPPPTLYHLYFRLRLPEDCVPVSLFLAPDDTPHPCRITPKYFEFGLERLNEFAMLVLNYRDRTQVK